MVDPVAGEGRHREMGTRFAVKKFGRITLVSVLLVCALCTPGESWTPQDYDGQWQVYSPGWSYMWLSSGNYAIWRNDAIGGGRFVYSYTPGQWFDGSWNTIGNSGASSAFIGDGAWHNLNNGWSYDYLYANDYAAWSNTSIGRVRFISAYTQGQWFDGSWNKIGGAGTSMAFLGDGTWHNLNNGWSYDYLASSDYAVWKNNAVGWGRFVYAYTPGQWYDGSWNKIGVGSTSSAFLGDGTWHNLNNGWSYDYIAAYDYAAWKNNAIGSVRFISAYTPGQWFDGTWNKIGDAGISTAFIGDGSAHTISTDWDFLYDSSADSGIWRRHTGAANRFKYLYSTGQWWDWSDYNSGAWKRIGGPGAYSSSFLGDGAWHNLGNKWSYLYNATSDYAQYRYSAGSPVYTSDRFRYYYSTGEWQNYDKLVVYTRMGNVGLSSAFMGDMNWHSLGNNWYYFFTDLDGSWGNHGFFSYGGTGKLRFKYDYVNGQWLHTNIDATAVGQFCVLGATNIGGTFIGNGSWNSLGNNWTYYYNASTDYGQWRISGVDQFQFNYVNGQWSHYDRIAPATWRTLSAALGKTNTAPTFMGDGSAHLLGDGWTYRFDGTSGTWTGSYQFKYTYGTGQWYITENDWLLGNSGISAVFMGDLAQHNLGNGWFFELDGSTGRFYRNASTLRFSLTGLNWTAHDGTASVSLASLGTSLGTTWLTDGVPHLTGTYCFSYAYGADELIFYTNVSGSPGAFLKYAWATHRWQDSRAGAGAWINVPTGTSGNPEIIKTYWSGWGPIDISPTYNMYIYGGYNNATETIVPTSTPSAYWLYHYATGWWDWYNGSTWTYNVSQGDPDDHR
jgi:hypothetical protein